MSGTSASRSPMRAFLEFLLFHVNALDSVADFNEVRACGCNLYASVVVQFTRRNYLTLHVHNGVTFCVVRFFCGNRDFESARLCNTEVVSSAGRDFAFCDRHCAIAIYIER